ncbi:MAG: phosphoribosylanthranilate isomerase [Ruminococcus sp.]|nr:phosphoribosylanthranilate isomerase [Ruminococcus sp.]
MLKLCGMRREEDIEIINEFPPEFMGMILSKGFGRSIEISQAEKLLKILDPKIKAVGVFVNESPETVSRTTEHLKLAAVQLHGSEDGDYINTLRKLLPKNTLIFKAVKVRTTEDIANADNMGSDFLMLDSFVKGKAGGTGQTFDWSVVSSANIGTPFFLAGGITPENLPAALAVSGNIDISGGVETEGVKDREKIKSVYERMKGK